MGQQLDELPRECIDALERGNLIEAIKLFRSLRHVGLKESKDAVDRYLTNHPDLARRLRMARASNGRSGVLWFLMLLVAGVLAYLWLRTGQ